jgi:hypothetical protein
MKLGRGARPSQLIRGVRRTWGGSAANATRRCSAAVLVMASLAAICGCRASRTTDTRSRQLSSNQEKVEFLARYLALKSPVEATEFHVVYHDNSGGLVPGPSDGDIEAVLKVQPQYVRLWVSGMRRVEASTSGQVVGSGRKELEWGYGLLPEAGAWQVSSEPVVYGSGDGSTTVAAFEAEGIVMVRVLQR